MKTGQMRKMKMNGKKNNDISLNALFNRQMLNQKEMIDIGLYDKFRAENTMSVPVDDVKLMSYHIQQLVSEVGEVLNADKRWKSHRNDKNDECEKIEEIADCFIVLMNIAMFSGFDGSQLTEAIDSKLNKISERIKNI